MGSCNARKNQIVRRSRVENSILQDMAVAMGTFRHTVASVEHRFLASCFLCFLGSHDTGQQIQGFDVAVKETGVLLGKQANLLVQVRCSHGL